MGHEILLKLMVFMVVASMVSTIAFGTTFRDDFKPTFGDNRVKMYGQDGKSLTLSLDKYSGSGFASKKEYLFGRFDIEMKFIAGDSAGSVTTFYLSSEENVSEGDAHDEIDFEFLGNASGQPYTIHTNVFGKGKGGREQQFHLWFDPTKNYHTYSIVWNPKRIIFLIDETPIRLFKNLEHMGVPYLRNQPMRIYSSLWNADEWATQGGAVKADWSKAPFTAYYRNPSIDACEGHNVASCVGKNAYTASTAATHRRHREWRDHDLTPEERRRMRWAHMHHKIYDYCNDRKRYPNGFPPECKHNRV